ncbi:aminotransferase class III-fold pyridoxal phosphate-dependent enzyme [Methylotuvimicrobium sp. KM1]|uniref:aminotransferase class III-fold pyridoxal phosphate-dependent enzyme n=1 Tax=Methylotuvimicrobium sp. KM1 TaxID=3377707 RepID=UPI00384E8689
MHHSTYARNRLAMVAGLATLEVMENDKLVENADAMGKRLMEGLNKLKDRYSLLKGVRGMGLMIGLSRVSTK